MDTTAAAGGPATCVIRTVFAAALLQLCAKPRQQPTAGCRDVRLHARLQWASVGMR